MTSVFVLHHVHTISGSNEEVKLIGVYSSTETANAAITRLRSAPGFQNTPEGFEITPYELDEDNWAEGFVTMP